MKLIPYISAVALLSLLGTTFAGPTPPAKQAGVRTIAITGTDDMKFSVTTIQAKPGERIRVVLASAGRMPKIAMAHNFVLLKKGADVDAFVQASAMARATDFIPPAQRAAVIAATGLAGANETGEVTFAAPSAPGTYPYICSFPGHYIAGMRGVLVVK